MLASSRKPCGGGNPRGRIWNPPLRPTANVETNRETTNPAISQTSVGDDACIVPETPRRRKAPREGHGPPLQTMADARPTGMAATTRATVGRDALIPPDPAAVQPPAGGYGIRPYSQRQMLRPTGKPQILRRGEGGGVWLRNIGRWRDIFRGGGRSGGCSIRGCGNLSRLQNGPGL